MAGGPEFVGGPEKRAIVLVPWSDEWPRRYERERDRIVGALGARARRVEHIGSTSVPGLAAKPIVDIQLSVADPDDEPAYLPTLTAAGYALRVREPGHRMVRTPDVTVQVHLCAVGSDWERRHLLFRDWLRHDPADRGRYEARKRELAARDWATTNDYAEAKSDIVAEITARAETWAAATGWDQVTGLAGGAG